MGRERVGEKRHLSLVRRDDTLFIPPQEPGITSGATTSAQGKPVLSPLLILYGMLGRHGGAGSYSTLLFIVRREVFEWGD